MQCAGKTVGRTNPDRKRRGLFLVATCPCPVYGGMQCAGKTVGRTNPDRKRRGLFLVATCPCPVYGGMQCAGKTVGRTNLDRKCRGLFLVVLCPYPFSENEFQPWAVNGILALFLEIKCAPSCSAVMCPTTVMLGLPLIFGNSFWSKVNKSS